MIRFQPIVCHLSSLDIVKRAIRTIQTVNRILQAVHIYGYEQCVEYVYQLEANKLSRLICLI